MPQTPYESDSGATSKDLFDLDLPVVREGEEPHPPEKPSYELMIAHARFLIDSGFDARRKPNPEPFVLD